MKVSFKLVDISKCYEENEGVVLMKHSVVK